MYHLLFTLVKVNVSFSIYFCKVNITVFVGVQLTQFSREHSKCKLGSRQFELNNSRELNWRVGTKL